MLRIESHEFVHERIIQLQYLQGVVGDKNKFEFELVSRMNFYKQFYRWIPAKQLASSEWGFICFEQQRGLKQTKAKAKGDKSKAQTKAEAREAMHAWVSHEKKKKKKKQKRRLTPLPFSLLAA